MQAHVVLHKILEKACGQIGTSCAADYRFPGSDGDLNCVLRKL